MDETKKIPNSNFYNKKLIDIFYNQTFESSICEVEALMEKGYALLKHADAHKFLAIFLKESFKFCCDLRNIAYEKLATLKVVQIDF